MQWEFNLGTGQSILVIFLISMLMWLRSRFQTLDTFRAMGLPGPTPHFLYGNMREVWINKKPWLVIDKWCKTYGKVFGCFPMGIRPIMVISDREILQDIMVGSFSNFRNRPALGPPRSEPGASTLTSIRGEKWRRVRNVISPTFANKKILQMTAGMNNAAVTLAKILDDQQNKETPFNIYGMFQALTLDVIAQAAFAMKVDSQTNPNDQLLTVCRALFKSFFSPVLKALLLFPEIGNMATLLRSRSTAANKEFYVITHMRKVFHERREEPSIRGNDMIQLMMDAADQTNANKVLSREPSLTSVSQEKSRTQPPPTSKYLTENELVANCFVFLLAGYETTANALAFTTYLLSKHQDVQQRLYEEIIDVIGSKDAPNFEDKNTKLPYLEAVISESLRIYPPITGFVMRECHETCVINGVEIPAGMAIHVPVWSLHHDPTVWPNPDSFLPERFLNNSLEAIDPMTYMPFGVGPRNCIGMTFALMEIRITLIRILQKFKFVEAEQSGGDLDLESPFVTMNPKNGVMVGLERR